ncbi:MAG: 30S ribosomal protein S12 methylthiotransferase RimO [Burkholderiaceae bacterium]|nr:MAG: 30S ribosomal protein S12 methylthiotransferase RimO [Burkholderiaceae bacterium]
MKKENIHSVGFISLGCPKALVDTERIVNLLVSDNIKITPSFQEADLVVVNTCGFIDAAIKESLDSIKEAKKKNGKVIVTGCLGAKKNSHGAPLITPEDLGVLEVTGPNNPIHTAKLIKKQLNRNDRFDSEIRNKRELSLKQETSSESSTTSSRNYLLTPSHYAYLKISEGCNQSCTFCIIPSMRGKLVSRKVSEIIQEAKNLVSIGVREIIIISQDTGAYGTDTKYQTEFVNGVPVKANLLGLVKELQKLKVWLRLHYIYPYKNIDLLIPLMEKKGNTNDIIPSRQGVVPYIDMPFQHAHPDILKKMKRPGKMEDILTRLSSWRKICPDLTIRSTFIVGFPGETETHFDYLIQFLTEAKLDRVGCFTYSPVSGAKANEYPDHIPEEISRARQTKLLLHQAKISENRLKRWNGKRVEVIIEGIDSEKEVLIGRGPADSPEIDGVIHVYPDQDNVARVEIGNFSLVEVIGNNEHDLIGKIVSN